MWERMLSCSKDDLASKHGGQLAIALTVVPAISGLELG